MRHSGLTAAALSLLVFGFLALMAWTGKFIGVDGAKMRMWIWVVQDMGVGTFGRMGATVPLVVLGIICVPLVLWRSGAGCSSLGRGKADDWESQLRDEIASRDWHGRTVPAARVTGGPA